MPGYLAEYQKEPLNVLKTWFPTEAIRAEVSGIHPWKGWSLSEQDGANINYPQL